MYVHISNKVSGLINFIFINSKRLFSTIQQLYIYSFGVESFTDGWIREQCNLTSRFPNVFVQGLNLAKNRPTSLIWTEYNSQNSWTAYLFRRKDEIFSASILCKLIIFVLSFMLQTYIQVFRWIPGETLPFCEIKFGHKKYPHPLNPKVLALICNIFQIFFILLGALNVQVWFKHKT